MDSPVADDDLAPAPGATVAPPPAADDLAPAPGAQISPPTASRFSPMAPAIKDPSLLDAAKATAGEAAQPFIDLFNGLRKANRVATQAMVHPVDTYHAVAANPGAYAREGLRGVNDNIPFAGRAVEALGGIPAESPQDAALAPGIREFGGVAGMPIGSMVGGIAAKGVEAVAPAASHFVQTFAKAADERQLGRAMEDLETGARQRARLGLEADAGEGAARAVIKAHPDVRKAVGHDADLLRATAAVKKQAAEVLDKAYVESPAARSAGSSSLRELEAKAKDARARATALEARAPAAPASLGPRVSGEAHAAPMTPSRLARMRADPEAAFWEGHPNAVENPLSLPSVEPGITPNAPASSASWDPHALAVDEAKAQADALEAQVAAKRRAGGSSAAPPPVHSSAPLAALDRRISALRGTKLPSDVDAAAALGKLRDKLAETIGKDGTLDPRKLRQIQSDYQREGYAKNINDDPEVSARIRANREASKAVGDAVLQHVTGMDYAAAKAAASANPNSLAARIFKANEQIEGANKIEATVADRMKAGKTAEPHGIGGAIKHIAAHAVGHAALPVMAGTMAHSPMAALQAAAVQEGLRYAPAAARGVAKIADRATMAIAPRVAGAIGGLPDSALARTILGLMKRGIPQETAVQMARSGVAPPQAALRPELATEAPPDPLVL